MEDLDLILSAEEGIVPSSGFTHAVMEAVRREAYQPTPIPFPWRRASLGLLLLAAVVIVLVFVPAPVNRARGTGLPTMQLAAMLRLSLAIMRRLRMNWLLGSLLLAWACVTLSMRLESFRS